MRRIFNWEGNGLPSSSIIQKCFLTRMFILGFIKEDQRQKIIEDLSKIMHGANAASLVLPVSSGRAGPRSPATNAGQAQPKLLKNQKRAVLLREGRLRTPPALQTSPLKEQNRVVMLRGGRPIC
jgi:hypothetical protein